MIKNKDAYMKPFTFVVNNNMSRQVDRTFGDRVSSREVLEKNKIKYTIPYDGDLEWFINRYNIKGQLVEKIVKKSDGYYVQSERGKNLGGPYKKIEDAERRLGQVEYFKNKDKKIESVRKGMKESLRFLSDPWKGRFSKSDNWVGGELEYNGATYKVRAKVFDEPSRYGINNGRISKLWVKEDGYPVVIDYDRGWVDGVSPYNEDLLNFVMKEVEKFKDKHPTPKGKGIEESVLGRGVDSSKEFSYNKSGKRGKVMVNESLIADKIEDMASADDVKVALEAEYADYPHVLEGLLEWIGDGEDFEEYRENLVNLLNEIEYLESTDQMDALEMATEDQGSSYFEDTVDIINRGDFLFFPGVEDDEELGHAFVDMCGGISAAVGRDRLATYIDIDLVAETFKEGMEDDPDLADMDDDAWYSLAEEQVEMSPESYEDYFDYDQYGRDLRMEGGYFFGDLGAIAIL